MVCKHDLPLWIISGFIYVHVYQLFLRFGEILTYDIGFGDHFCGNVLSFLARIVLYQQHQVHQVFSAAVGQPRRVLATWSFLMPRIVVYVIPVVFVVLQLFVYDFLLRIPFFFFVYHLHIHVHLFSRLRPPPFKTTSSPPYPPCTFVQLHDSVYISLHFSFLSPMYFVRVVNLTVDFSCWTCCNSEPVVLSSCILAVTLFGPMNGQAGELPAYILWWLRGKQISFRDGFIYFALSK